MTLNEIAEKLQLIDLTPEIRDEKLADVTRGHASDLLSDVLAHAPGGGVLVTIQVHMNVLAVSVNAGLAAVIFVSGRAPEESVRQKAIQERIPLYVSNESTFDIVGKLYGLGLRGHHA
jgi:hypothetical protein